MVEINIKVSFQKSRDYNFDSHLYDITLSVTIMYSFMYLVFCIFFFQQLFKSVEHHLTRNIGYIHSVDGLKMMIRSV